MCNIYKNGDYFDNNPNWHEEDSPWKANHIFNIIKKNNLSPQSICEIGCGAGEILNQLSIKFPRDVRFYGYEISPQAFELCSKKSKTNLAFKLSDLLNEDSLSFDITLAIDVFEHVDDYLGFLRKLKSKSEFSIFHIPLDLSAQAVIRSSVLTDKRNAIGHVHYFTKDTALATLQDTGYEIIDTFYTASAIELSGRSLKGRILNYFRKIMYFINKDFAVRLFGGYSLMVLAK